MSAGILALLVALAAPAQEGQVALPLGTYLDLTERAAAADRVRENARREAQPGRAELVSQHASIAWDQTTQVETRFVVDVVGDRALPLELPFTGVSWRTAISPPGSASLRASDSGVELIAPQAGRYEVTVWSQVEADGDAGRQRLELAPLLAPVGDVAISLPPDRLFSCARGVMAEDDVRDGRRHVRFAPPRGEAVAVESRRDLGPSSAEELLASSVIVTALDVDSQGVRRHDFVLYEVSRGSLQAFDLQLPPGLEAEAFVSDEDEAVPLVEGDRIRVERETRLEGQGHLVVSSRPELTDSLSLEPIEPAVGVRARYLVVSLSVAADVTPRPDGSWQRVDLADLPEALEETAARWLKPVAAWRWMGPEGPARVGLSLRPAAPALDGVVSSRRSLSLLTAEGTLLTHDVLTVTTQESSLTLRLPAGTTLWSAQVGEVPVRPLERPDATDIPLGFGGVEETRVEIVAVRERELERGKSRLALTLPEVSLPVLSHEWRLMLPDSHRYRYATGDLAPAPQPGARVGPQRDARRLQVEPSSVVSGRGGDAGVTGRVLDSAGGVIPGAVVTLSDQERGSQLSVTTDSQGAFWFRRLRAGSYTLNADMPGFKPETFSGIRLSRGETPAYAITLSVGEMSETILVEAEPERLFEDREVGEEQQRAAEYGRQLSELRQGLVGGVRPVPVEIPASGKLLFLAGALPPQQVRLELEAKSR